MSSIVMHTERKRRANKIINIRTLMATGAGFIPIPLLDTASILSIQLWMIRDISRVYEVPFKKHRVKSLIGTLVGNIGTVGIIKMIPGLGSFLGGGAVATGGAAATYALGKIFTQHFHQGGTLLNFDPVKSQEHFRQLYEEGKASVKELQQQETGFKEVSTQAEASTIALQKANEELKATIVKLQAQLRESKKDRKFTLAVLRNNKNRKVTRLLWFLFLIVLAAGAFWLYRAGNLSFLGNKEATDKTEKPISKKEKTPEKSAENSETKLENSAVIDTATIADSTALVDSSAIIIPLDTIQEAPAFPDAEALGFLKGTSEARIADYLSDSISAFPKTFALATVQFDEGSSEISENAQLQILNLVKIMEAYPTVKIRIYGHTDQLGGQADNRKAGRLRAKAAEVVLKQSGIEGRRIKTTFMEKTSPDEGKRSLEVEILER